MNSSYIIQNRRSWGLVCIIDNSQKMIGILSTNEFIVICNTIDESTYSCYTAISLSSLSNQGHIVVKRSVFRDVLYTFIIIIINTSPI